MVKQVIIVRKDLNMRKGKMIAQGAHASVNALLQHAIKDKHPTRLSIPLTNDVERWFNEGCTKISVSVNSERALVALYKEAKLRGLLCSLIKDSGRTEFKEPTLTAVAIGPGSAEEIDKITGELPLL